MKDREFGLSNSRDPAMAEELGQDDQALVRAAQAGDRSAMQQLLIRNWTWLKCLVYGVIGKGDLDDVMQEISLKVIRRISTLRQPEAFRPWLAALAHRQALRWRSRRPIATVSLDDTSVPEPVDQHTEAVVAAAEQEDMCQYVLQVIQQLPEKYREVIMLQYSKQLSYKEIAKILDVPLTTVQIRLVRARRMILEAIERSSKRRIQNG
ncbi:MAG: RNA polymerase sigma factor [Sedimentisphaerales bacterium]|nr:RNA polymerase sigma factor [Sedimentisphaerales bacterium]